MFLPTDPTAMRLGIKFAQEDEKRAKRHAAQVRIQKSQGRAIVLNHKNAEQVASRSKRKFARASADGILRRGGFTTGARRNDGRRDYQLPKVARSMAVRRGRFTPSGVEHFVSSYSSQFAMAQQMLSSFLPVKVDRQDALRILAPYIRTTQVRRQRVSKNGAYREVKVVLTPSTSWPFFRATPLNQVMAKVNPNTGRVGGRPRKAQLVGSERWGARRATQDMRPVGGPTHAAQELRTAHRGFGRGAQDISAMLDAYHEQVVRMFGPLPSRAGV